MCKVKFGTGSNPFNNKKARVSGVLAKHCHVEFLEGDKQGQTKKIVKGNLELFVEGAEAGATPGADVGESTVTVADATASDEEPLAPGGADSVGWQDAADVFSG